MFCIKCGKDASVENMCNECFLKGKKLFEIEKVKISLCDNCNNFFSGKKRINDIQAFILNCIKTKNKITKKSIEIENLSDKLKISIKVEGFIIPCKKRVKDEKKYIIYLKNTKCENCSRLIGGYHEAVIQIRGEKKDILVKKIFECLKKDEITDIEKIREGYNIKIVNKNSSRRVINTIRNECIIKQSFKLVGKKKGKLLYRNFYLVK